MNSCDKRVLDTVRQYLPAKYGIACLKDEDNIEFQKLIQGASDCFDAKMCNSIFCFGAYAYEIGKKGILSYITFTKEVSDETGQEYIHINDSCTNLSYRRIGLSTILRMFPLLYAKYNKIPYVTSYASTAASKAVLKKMGFHVYEDFIGKFNWEANSYFDFSDKDADEILEKLLQKLKR